MDKGNHYKKCDLQIHTPRDRNWKGGPKVTEEDRDLYSRNFIKECRDAGLDAIAITDHHDMVFYEYIKKASLEELDEEGNAIPEENRIIIFPGVELTLHSPPIQGLLIFDANFPIRLFPTILGALSLAQAPKTDSKTSQTVAIPSGSISSINDIYFKLDGTDGVKGRYVFLPHVKEKGHKTLMRDGFHEAYAKMPCGAGYVDGKFENGGVGYLKVLDGTVAAYGYKSIAVIQTTDYRAEKEIKDYDVATWIKLKEPTAEALRQACLAKESRISLTVPEIPNTFIEKIDVTNSAFLSKFDLDFNPQLNSIIGGRGSGKSTILEYLRWALCDQTEKFGSDEAKTEIERKRNSLIEKTLKEVDGEVRVFFNVNGTRHIIKRNPKSEEVKLKIGDEEFQSVRPSQISNLLPIQAYSQKQLSSISIRPDELKRFIVQPIANEIEEIDKQIESASKKTRTDYLKLSSSKKIESDIKNNSLDIKSFKLQIEELKGGLKGISEDDKKTIDRAKFYVNEKNRLDEINLEYSTVNDGISELKELVEKLNGISLEEGVEYENIEKFKLINDERNKYLKDLLENLTNLEKTHLNSETTIETLIKDWDILKIEFQKEYLKAKEKTTSSQATLNGIKELEGKLEKLELIIRQKKVELSSYTVTELDFSTSLKDFIKLQDLKINKLKESTEFFTKLSDGLIKVDFSKIINANNLSKSLISLFSGSSLNIPKARSIQLTEFVSNSEDSLKNWLEIILEFKLLSEFNINPESQNEYPHSPILDSLGFSIANKKKITENLNSNNFLDIATISLDFLPKFKYQTNNQMEDEIPFEDASAGQQATALLNVLLNQNGFPLIIDQPEDDIDNRAIEKIIKNLWNSKKHRQIIFSSHNANLVVNGDSELVICCDYNETSNQTKGQIKHEGSIDKKEIRDEITSIMEGGERAFKLRKEKYGF
ncbi:type III restriction enzyme [Polaribacter sp. KT25b]|uniref:TrlF family AAA-like ATPase n=1 Tax=Polaribacter sp. KT25b TaxID=1855336 RepID=UPI00087CC46F|nr:AAA family ATPase [Polaribacter sp. KT25b]SDR67114.1 type III restriction enzyme [Polaribacter sp. KT25b]